MSNPRNVWLAGALTLAMAAPSFAQVTRERTTVRSGASKTTTTSVVKLSNVMKSKVLIQSDEPGGQIVDVVINDGGCVDYYVASYEDEYYVIPYSAITWRDNSVFVDITPAQFKKIEFFSSNNWPDLTATSFQRQVFSTFGVSSLRSEGQRSTFKPDTSDRRDDRQDRRDDARDDTRDRSQDRRDDRQDRRDDARDQARDRQDNRQDRREDTKDQAKDQARDRQDNREDRRDDAKESAQDRRDDRDSTKPDAKPDPKKPGDSKPQSGATDPAKKPATPDKKPGTVPKREGADKPGDKKPAPLPNPPKPGEKDPK